MSIEPSEKAFDELQQELYELRQQIDMDEAWQNQALKDEAELRRQIAKQSEQLRVAKDALELISYPNRSDGIYNRCCKARQNIAKEALAKLGEEES